jgi:ABC-type polysaccharide/polyol phosphate export permease
VPAPSTRLRAASLPLELLVNLTLRELRGKFKRTALGWGWSVLNPVLNLAVYATVFGVFLRLEPPVGDPSGLDSYPFFLICGLLPWTFLAISITTSGASYVANEALVKKVYFPRSTLPAAGVAATLITFLIELTVLSVALLLAGNMVLPWLPIVLAVVALQAGFALGIGLIMAALNARFRDVSHLLTVGLNVWFYATPILYPRELVPDTVRVLGVGLPAAELVRFNPMYHFVAAYRDLLYDLRAPALGHWVVMLLSAGTMLGAGVLVHRRFEPRLAELL